MTNPGPIQSTARKPLRLWPGVAAVTLQWLVLLIVPLVVPHAAILGVLGALACGAVILLWWLFFSRAPWGERVGAILLWVVAVFAVSRFVDKSVANGMMGRMLPMFSTPVMCLALVGWAATTRGLGTGARRAALVGAMALGAAAMTLIRTDGVTGDARPQLHWRWTPTAEERLLARSTEEIAPALEPAPDQTAVKDEGATKVEAPKEPPPSVAAPSSPSGATDKPTTGNEAAIPRREAEWPGFRGLRRDSVVRGVRIETDWAQKPPVALWRKPIGPGWSSFAVDGDLIYTQEQRAKDEIVSCYRLSTGAAVWRHRDAARFEEASEGGPGPRATPTLHHGRVYTMGATGIVNALDGRTGKVVWSRDAAADTGAPMPGWGFTGSPLALDDLVVVAASGRLVAYDAAGGTPHWVRKTGGGGYSSPHLATIDGVPQVLLLNGGGVTSVALADGAVLWEHPGPPGVGIVQPGFTSDGDILVGPGDAMGGLGLRRLAVTRGPSGWKVEERWVSRGLKPYFNDFVVHEGHAFGFDGSILSCINLQDGERKWKGGRYGHGQMLLLPEQDMILLVSEEGELALVKASPDQFTPIARVPGIEGKTWSHPVLVGDVLLIRNGEEMAAFRLPLAASSTEP